MICANVLQQVQYLCKNVRKSNKHFGGIQVIFVVDLYRFLPFRMNCMAILANIVLCCHGLKNSFSIILM